MKKISVRTLAQGAVIAALYAALTLIPGLSLFAFEPIQLRVSEALTVLPMYTGAGVWGLWLGCIISNLLSPFGPNPVDIVLGGLASLAAALLTRRLRGNRYLALLPPVLVNAVVVGSYLPFVYTPDVPVAASIAFVAAGQAVVCFGLGLPLSYLLDRHKRIFE